MRRHKAAQYDLSLPGEEFALMGERMSKEQGADGELMRQVFNADEALNQARLRFEVAEAARIIAENDRKWEV